MMTDVVRFRTLLTAAVLAVLACLHDWLEALLRDFRLLEGLRCPLAVPSWRGRMGVSGSCAILCMGPLNHGPRGANIASTVSR
jgi:hypothetical protein